MTQSLFPLMRCPGPQLLEPQIEAGAGLFRHLGKAHSEAKARLAVQRLCLDHDPSLIGQVNLEGELAAPLRFLERGDETASLAQVIDPDRRFQRVNPLSIERSRYPEMSSPVFVHRCRRILHHGSLGTTSNRMRGMSVPSGDSLFDRSLGSAHRPKTKPNT